MTIARLLNLTLVFALLAGLAAVPADAAPLSDLPGWAETRSLTVRNTASTPLPAGYTARLELDTATLVSQGLMQPNCADLRLTYAGTELHRLVTDCNTAATLVHFRTSAEIPVGSETLDYQLHYANPTAGVAPSDPAQVYAVYDDFQDGDAAGWNAAKGSWAVVDDGGNFVYRYTGGGANWALSYVAQPGLSDLDYTVRLRAAANTSWIGTAFRVQDINNFQAFYQSRDVGQFKAARIVADNHQIGPSPVYDMAANAWYRLRVQALGSQLRARLWAEGEPEPATWRIQTTDTAFATASGVGLTLYFHDTQADWDDVQARRLVDSEPQVLLQTAPIGEAPWWDAAYGYRTRLTVTNTAATSLPARYTARLVLDTSSLITAGQLLDNCADLRLVSYDGLTNEPRDRVVDSCGREAASIWFALRRPIGPGSSDDTYYLYYGQPAAGAPPANGDQVFLFAEDWEQGAPHWTGAAGLDAGNTGTLGTSQISDEAAVSSSHSQKFPQKMGGGDAFSGYLPVQPNTRYALSVWGRSSTPAYAPVGIDPYTSALIKGAENWLWTNEWSLPAEWAMRSAAFTTGADTAYLKLKSEWWLEGPGTQPVYLDDLRLRYAAASEPTVTPGVEESTLPGPDFGLVTANGPVNLGEPVQVTAAVSVPAGSLDAVSLLTQAPETHSLPMTLVTGTTADGTWSASFTPAQGGVYTYRVLARSTNGRARLSAAQTFTVIDSEPPQITLLGLTDPLLVRETQTVRVSVTDNGQIAAVDLASRDSSGPMTLVAGGYERAWPINAVGLLTFTVTARDTAGNTATLNGSFEAQAREVDVCTWKGCKTAAASWSIDDGNPSCGAELNSYNLHGTFYVNGSGPQQWYTDYALAGHEIAAHTVSHPCDPPACSPNCTPEALWQIPFTPAESEAYGQTEFEPNVAGIEAATGQPVLTAAWPCGCADARRMTAAQRYFLGVRGYFDWIANLTFVQDLNPPTPLNWMLINSANSYDQSFVDRAIAEGKWTTITSHGSCAGLDYLAGRRDVLWVDTIGAVAKYIRVRDAAQLTNYTRLDRTLSFDAQHTLSPLERQQVDGTPMSTIYFDNAVTLKVHLQPADSVLNVQVNGATVPFELLSTDGTRYVVFDTPLDTPRHVTVNLAAPLPAISAVSDNGPVEIGALASVAATVSVSEGQLGAVTLQVLAPEPAGYPMSPLAGEPGRYTASFTPTHLGSYTYRIVAVNNEGAQAETAVLSLAVTDSTAPTWRALAHSRAALPPGGINTLSAEALDLGGLGLATLETDESGAWQSYGWPISDWWHHAWTQRRAITVEAAGLAQPAALLDLDLPAADFPGLTDCAELRVADIARVEVTSQSSVSSAGCRLLFQADLPAGASRTYYVYWGNPAAGPPDYVTDLTSSQAGPLLTVRSAFFDLDLNTDSGILTRVRLPQGSNTDLPLATAAHSYWGWHQVCSSLDGNITGKNSLCSGGVAPAGGLDLAVSLDGPVVKEYTLTQQRGTATYTLVFRFLAGAPYYYYRLEHSGTTAAVMNNFWYANGSFAALSAGAAPAAYNAYSTGLNHVLMAAAQPVDWATIDGQDNDGTQLGGHDYRQPSAPGLALVVATGNSLAATQTGLAQAAAAATTSWGAVEAAPEGQYGSPFDAAGATGWTSVAFTWQNPSVPAGTSVRWRIAFCDLAGRCATTDTRSFTVQTSNPPPSLPASFYGQVQFSDTAPQAGDTLSVQIAGAAAAFSVPLVSHDGLLVYQLDLPGDNPDTPAKDGGQNGDAVTFRWDERLLGVSEWYAGTNRPFHLHPPAASFSAGPAHAGSPVTLDASLSADAGGDPAYYAFDCDGNGGYEIGPQAAPTTTCTFTHAGEHLVGLRVEDARGGLGEAALAVNVAPAQHTLALEPGWNLVSFNVAPAAPAPAAVLAGLPFDLVFAWDAPTQSWRRHDPAAPAFANDLTMLTSHQGFWVRLLEAGTLVVPGPVVLPDTAIELHPGWNLVGYPSTAERPLPAALLSYGVGQDFNLIYSYRAADANSPWKLFDRSATFGNVLTALAPGWGYWVNLTSNAPRTWSVEYR